MTKIIGIAAIAAVAAIGVAGVIYAVTKKNKDAEVDSEDSNYDRVTEELKDSTNQAIAEMKKTTSTFCASIKDIIKRNSASKDETTETVATDTEDVLDPEAEAIADLCDSLEDDEDCTTN